MIARKAASPRLPCAFRKGARVVPQPPKQRQTRGCGFFAALIAQREGTVDHVGLAILRTDRNARRRFLAA